MTQKSRGQHFTKNRIATAVLLFSALPTVGHAQESTSEDPPQLPAIVVTGQRDEVTVGGKIPAAVRDIPQTVNVINRETMDSQAATSIKDALRYVPGITISAGEGSQIGDNINLRGFSARTDVYLDGFRDRGQYSRDTFFLESVEVLKGPSSMLFGRGSTGGVINQVSKTPSLSQFAELSTTIGTDDYYRVTADINQPLSATSAARIAIMGQDIHSTRDVVFNKDFGIAPSLKLGIGTPTEITLSGLFQKNHDLPDYGFPLLTQNGTGTVAKPIDAPANRFYGYEDDHFNQDVRAFTATIKHQLSSQLTLRNRTQYAQYGLSASPSPLTVPTGVGAPTLSTPLSAINLVRQDRDREIDDTSLFNQADLIFKTKFGSVGNTLISGLELGTDKYIRNDFAYDRPAPPPDPRLINLESPVYGTRSGRRYNSIKTQTTAQTVALYANDQVDLGEQWKFIAGLRWDRFKADSTILNIANNGVVTVPAQPAAETDLMFSPRTGVIYQPTKQQSYYVSYGVSFNPSAEAVTQSSGATAANASLPPEKNRSYEIGGKWDLMQSNLLLSAALFRIEKTNARTNDPTIGGLQSLAGVVRVDGVELGATGRITPNWVVLSGYTYLASEIVQSPEIGTGSSLGIPAQGKRYPNTPKHSASLWSTYTFLQDYELGGGVLYVSERSLNNFETAVTDGYARGDLTAAFHQPIYDLRVNLQNVTNEKYFDAASSGRATPVRGRTLLFTGTLRFGQK